MHWKFSLRKRVYLQNWYVFTLYISSKTTCRVKLNLRNVRCDHISHVQKLKMTKIQPSRNETFTKNSFYYDISFKYIVEVTHTHINTNKWLCRVHPELPKGNLWLQIILSFHMIRPSERVHWNMKWIVSNFDCKHSLDKMENRALKRCRYVWEMSSYPRN